MSKAVLIIIRAILFFFFWLILCGEVYAQFTADLIQTENGISKTGKIYFEDPFYRMDLQEQGENFYVLVDQKNKLTKVVRPKEKMYIEMSSTGMSSIQNDVFQSVEKQKQMYETKLVGTEDINGYECKKYDVLIDGKPATTFWQSTKLDFPLKVVTGKNNNMIMELKNIKPGDVDNSYFIVPDDFKKVEMPVKK